jgi:RecA/RadA recombinase
MELPPPSSQAIDRTDDLYEEAWMIMTHLYRDRSLFQSSKDALDEMNYFQRWPEVNASFAYLKDYCSELPGSVKKISVMNDLANNFDYFQIPQDIRTLATVKTNQIFEHSEGDLDVGFIERFIQLEYREHLAHKFQQTAPGSADEMQKRAREFVAAMDKNMFMNIEPISIFDNLEYYLANLTRTKTGVPFLDYMLAGGTLPGELIGILAPSGGGKSTVANMALASCVRSEKDCWYFSTEQKLRGDIGTRHACLATQSPRSKFKGGYAGLNEADRAMLERVAPKWKKHCLFMDVTTEKDIMSVEQLFECIRRRIEVTGTTPGMIIVDWWGRLSDAMSMAQPTSLSEKELRKFDRDQLHKAKQLCEEFNCPGLIFHQLSGQANARGPQARLSSADAQENKAFNNMFDFAVVLGNRDSDDILKATTDKARGEARSEVKLKLNGAYCRMDLADDTDSMNIDALTSAPTGFGFNPSAAASMPEIPDDYEPDIDMNTAGI